MDDDTDSGITKYQNGLGIDNKLELTNGTDTKYFLSDHLGSTVALTDSTGSVSSSASYDSFGNSTNDLATRYQYTGREFDSFTGLHYYRARWYDPNLGRFISEALKRGLHIKLSTTHQTKSTSSNASSLTGRNAK
jgi:RHS repeat-associated protein